MIDATFEIKSIDYEKTFDGLFPVLLEKSRNINNKHILIRLFRRLGEEARFLFGGFISRLPEKEKNELLSTCVGSYSGEIKKMLNEYLSGDQWGKNFSVEGIRMYRQENKMFLEVLGIKTDYNALVEEEKIHNSIMDAAESRFGKWGRFVAEGAKPLLKAAVKKAPEYTESMVLELLNRDGNTVKMLGLLQNALFARNLYISLENIAFHKTSFDEIREEVQEAGIHLSYELEEAILDALADNLLELRKM